jgi:hypothetical protein
MTGEYNYKGDYGAIADRPIDSATWTGEDTSKYPVANAVYINTNPVGTSNVMLETTQDTKYQQFEDEIRALINKLSLEGNSNTPDFILAEFLTNCLKDWDSVSSYEQFMDSDEVLWDYLWLARRTFRNTKTVRAKWYMPVIAEKIASSWWKKLYVFWGRLWVAYLNNGNYSDAWKK